MKIISKKYGGIPAWPVQSGEMHEWLGFTSSKMPAAFSCDTYVTDGIEQAWNVVVFPSAGNGKRRHRVFVRCSCGMLVSFGRVQQHKCKVQS